MVTCCLFLDLPALDRPRPAAALATAEAVVTGGAALLPALLLLPPLLLSLIALACWAGIQTLLPATSLRTSACCCTPCSKVAPGTAHGAACIAGTLLWNSCCHRWTVAAPVSCHCLRLSSSSCSSLLLATWASVRKLAMAKQCVGGAAGTPEQSRCRSGWHLVAGCLTIQ